MKWLADENFRGAIVRGVLRHSPGFDIVRVQDIPQVYGDSDPAMLLWAAAERRVVLTHDVSTMIPAMRELSMRALDCPRIVLVSDSLPVGAVVEDILLLEKCSVNADWSAGVVYRPLR